MYETPTVGEGWGSAVSPQPPFLYIPSIQKCCANVTLNAGMSGVVFVAESLTSSLPYNFNGLKEALWSKDEAMTDFKTFVNFSNHPSTGWSDSQKAAALNMVAPGAAIIDIPFPAVDPTGDDNYISKVAADAVRSIMSATNGAPAVVNIQGDFGLTFRVVSRILNGSSIKCVYATTARTVTDLGDGKKVAQFNFVQFRPYTF